MFSICSKVLYFYNRGDIIAIAIKMRFFVFFLGLNMPNIKNQKLILDQYMKPPQSQLFIIDERTIGMTICFDDYKDQNTFISNYQRGLEAHKGKRSPFDNFPLVSTLLH